jgi:hypothetical protein
MFEREREREREMVANKRVTMERIKKEKKNVRCMKKGRGREDVRRRWKRVREKERAAKRGKKGEKRERSKEREGE